LARRITEPPRAAEPIRSPARGFAYSSSSTRCRKRYPTSFIAMIAGAVIDPTEFFG